MRKFKVGSVPFINARPLVAWFESHGTASPVEVIYDIPSNLPNLLNSGNVQAVLVSSIHALNTPNRTIADGVCIGSDGPAESVKVFSRTPFGKIKTLALDQSSLTSNALAQGILRESFGADPITELCAPDIDAMLTKHDACVLIGDIGMQAGRPHHNLNVMDLGQAWQDLIGLPFVWAAWVGQNDLEPELVELLNESWIWGKHNMNQVVAEASAKSGWSLETTDRYLRKTMRYDLDEPAKQGLNTFALMLSRNRVLENPHKPRIVSPVHTR